MSLDGVDALVRAVRQRIEQEGLRPFASRGASPRGPARLPRGGPGRSGGLPADALATALGRPSRAAGVEVAAAVRGLSSSPRRRPRAVSPEASNSRNNPLGLLRGPRPPRCLARRPAARGREPGPANGRPASSPAPGDESRD